jgi:hypothetical protein
MGECWLKKSQLILRGLALNLTNIFFLPVKAAFVLEAVKLQNAMLRNLQIVFSNDLAERGEAGLF